MRIDTASAFSPLCIPSSSSSSAPSLVKQSSKKQLVSASCCPSSPPLTPSSGCPLSRRCCLEEDTDIVEHLRAKHFVQECSIPQDAQRVGSMNVETPILVSKWSGAARVSALLVQFDGHLFLWMLQARHRADGEVQISVTTQFLRKDDEPQTTKKTTQGWDDSSFCLNNSFESSDDNCYEKINQYKVQVMVKFAGHDDEDLHNTSPTTTTSTSTTSSSSSSSSSNNTTSSSSQSTPSKLLWNTVLKTQKSFIRTQERLTSEGQSLVVLYPTHLSAFSAPRPVSSSSLSNTSSRTPSPSSDDYEVNLSVLTTMECLSPSKCC